MSSESVSGCFGCRALIRNYFRRCRQSKNTDTSLGSREDLQASSTRVDIARTSSNTNTSHPEHSQNNDPQTQETPEKASPQMSSSNLGTPLDLPSNNSRDTNAYALKDIFNSRPELNQVEENINKVCEQLELFKKRQMKIERDGKPPIVVAEALNAVLERIRAYTHIGGIMVQSDPTIAALAWGSFMFLLQLVGSDAELSVKVAETMGLLLDYVKIYKVYEDAYKYRNLESAQNVQRHIRGLYSGIEEFCKKALTFYDGNRSAGTRIAGSLLKPFSITFTPILDAIKEKRDLLERAVESAKFADKRRKELLDWISGITSFDDYFRTQDELRSESTCGWLLYKEDFKSWHDEEESKILRLYGRAGTGKSVLSTFVVRHLKDVYNHISLSYPVLYFYCRHDDPETLQPQNILASLLKQLLASRFTIPEDIYKDFEEKHNIERNKKPLHLLKHLLVYFKNTLQQKELKKVFIVIDGIDECKERPKDRAKTPFSRADLLNFLKDLVEFGKKQSSPSVKIFVASRNESDIKRILKTAISIPVGLEQNGNDIDVYINSQIPKYIGEAQPFADLLEANPELKEEVAKILKAKSEGMFTYIYFQLRALAQEYTEAGLRDALEKLPDGQEEVYLRILKKMGEQPQSSKRLAKQVLSWLLYAARPLQVLELTDALVVDTDNYTLDEKRKHLGNNIVRICSNLIVVERLGGKDVFRFTHFSVSEFLTDMGNKSLSEPVDPRKYTFSSDETHLMIANVCLAYCSFEKFSREAWKSETLFESREEFESFIKTSPLFDYSATYWSHHYTACSSKTSEIDGRLDVLFSKPQNLLLSFQTHWFRTVGDGFPQNPSILHIASYFGLEIYISRMLSSEDNGSEDRIPSVNALDGMNRTPLHWSCSEGHSAATGILLQNGADLSILDKKGTNALGLAAQNGHAHVVKQILEWMKQERGAGLGRSDREILSRALLCVSRSWNNVSAELLLDAGADPNYYDPATPQLQDPLTAAAWIGNLQLMKLLLSHGAAVDSGREYGNALQQAAANGASEAVELLIRHGADVRARGGGAGSALNAAAFRGDKGCVKALLEAGAIVKHPDDDFGGAYKLASHQNGDDEELLGLLRAAMLQQGSDKINTHSSGIPLKRVAENGLNIQAMDRAAKSFLETVEGGQKDISAFMMEVGKQILRTAISGQDYVFIEQFYDMIDLQLKRISNTKNAHLMSLLYDLLQFCHDVFLEEWTSETIPPNDIQKRLYVGFRRTLTNAIEYLIQTEFYPMIKALPENRSYVVSDLILSISPTGTGASTIKRALQFFAEWIRIGVILERRLDEKGTILAQGFSAAFAKCMHTLQGISSELALETIQEVTRPHPLVGYLDQSLILTLCQVLSIGTQRGYSTRQDVITALFDTLDDMSEVQKDAEGLAEWEPSEIMRIVMEARQVRRMNLDEELAELVEDLD